MRGALDFAALSQAVARPGIDPRAWVALARVDDDPDAVVWDADLGWIVDVTFASGPLAGDGPVTCRVASSVQGAGLGVSSPVRGGGLVLVVIPSGDPNEDAVIVGQLHDTDGAGAPSSVNGDSIVETGATAGQVAADETHIAAFADEDLEGEFRRVRLGASQHAGVVSPEVCLGTDDASEQAIKGNARNDDVGAFLDAMLTFCTTVAATGLPGIANAATQLQTAVVTLRAQLPGHLAQRVKVA